jgi:hypothetical protein
MGGQRQYWVVSPNVMDQEKTVEEWEKEILRARAAIMGWSPDAYGHGQIGPKFAGKTARSVQRTDIVIIARRHNWAPDIVGFGVVKGELRAKRLPPSDDEAYLRDLDPFKPWVRVPQGIPLIDVLRHTKALVQLHPESDEAHKKVCNWMERQLGLEDREVGSKGIAGRTTKQRHMVIKVTDLPQFTTFGYKVKTEGQVKMARKVEAKLLSDYEHWLGQHGRQLSAVKYNRIQCDGWEKERRNLIEAKGSTSREDIRMAVGQLLDYAFQGKEEFKRPHMAILLPNEPDPDSVKWLEPLGIKIIWRRGQSFLDNANGRFTQGKPAMSHNSLLAKADKET